MKLEPPRNALRREWLLKLKWKGPLFIHLREPSAACVRKMLERESVSTMRAMPTSCHDAPSRGRSTGRTAADRGTRVLEEC